MTAVDVTCRGCNNQWTVSLCEGDQIGLYGDLGDGCLHGPNVTVQSTRGCGTYVPEECSVCGRNKKHKLEVQK